MPSVTACQSSIEALQKHTETPTRAFEFTRYRCHTVRIGTRQCTRTCFNAASMNVRVLYFRGQRLAVFMQSLLLIGRTGTCDGECVIDDANLREQQHRNSKLEQH
jgi:hypothetical protein